MSEEKKMANTKVERAVKWYRTLELAAAHYRVPFNDNGWIESIARDCELSETERAEFVGIVS